VPLTLPLLGKSGINDSPGVGPSNGGGRCAGRQHTLCGYGEKYRTSEPLM
jgi:hypothetical protein